MYVGFPRYPLRERGRAYSNPNLNASPARCRGAGSGSRAAAMWKRPGRTLERSDPSETLTPVTIAVVVNERSFVLPRGNAGLPQESSWELGMPQLRTHPGLTHRWSRMPANPNTDEILGSLEAIQRAAGRRGSRRDASEPASWSIRKPCCQASRQLRAP